MKPQEPIPHNYSMGKLNLIFAVSSLALLLATGAMVFYDYVRGWKWFQLEFNRLQQERIDRELTAQNDAEMKKQLAAFDIRTKPGAHAGATSKIGPARLSGGRNLVVRAFSKLFRSE